MPYRSQSLSHARESIVRAILLVPCVVLFAAALRALWQSRDGIPRLDAGGILPFTALVSIGVCCAVLGSLATARRFRARAQRQVRELTERALRIAEGDLNPSAVPQLAAEAGTLLAAFDRMTLALRARDQAHEALARELRDKNQMLEVQNSQLQQLLARLIDSEEGKERAEREQGEMAEVYNAQVEQLLARLIESEQGKDRLFVLSYTDSLTGLKNRRFFEARADSLTFADGSKPGAMIIMDVDRFKAINDRWGHPAGDAVLAAIGSVLKRNRRSHDEAIRYAGDEFLVLLRYTDRDGAQTVAERIRSQVAALRFPFGEGEQVATVSAGVAVRKAGEGVRALLVRADRALYQAKNRGRNGAVVDEESEDPAAAEA